MPTRKTSAAKAAKSFEIADRRRRVALLMRSGWQQQEIAEVLKVSEATVSADVAAVKSLLRVESQEAMADLVAQELAALDGDEAVLRELMGLAKTESSVLRIHEAILKVQQRRAQLAGLDEASRRKQGESGAATLDALLREVLREQGRQAEA